MKFGELITLSKSTFDHLLPKIYKTIYKCGVHPNSYFCFAPTLVKEKKETI